MSSWFCYGCDEDIGDNEYCPYCGMHRSGDDAMDEQEARAVLAQFAPKRTKKEKQPIFTEEEAFLMGIHSQDAFFRKTMELDILGKDYDE